MKFLDYKEALELGGFTVTVDHITTRLGEVLAGFDPYGGYWVVDPAVQEILSSPVVVEKVRSRTTAGHFVKDDPATPQNEAWTTKITKPASKKK